MDKIIMLEPILFSIIIPSYNRANLIENTIHSFLNQSYPNFEIIVVDDGSTDDTEAVINNFNNQRIKYHYKKNGERGAARNYGADLAKGLYLNFFDSDDIASKNHLEEALKAIAFLKEPSVFHLGMNMKDLDGKEIFSVSNTKYKEKIFRCNYVNPNAVFVHKKAFEEVRYNEDRELSGSEDWLFHLQLASRFKFIPFDKMITSSMLQHDGRSMITSSAQELEKRSELLMMYLNVDTHFIKYRHKEMIKIKSEMDTLTSLYFAIEHKHKVSLNYLLIGIIANPLKIFNKRFLAIIKIIAFNSFRD